LLLMRHLLFKICGNQRKGSRAHRWVRFDVFLLAPRADDCEPKSVAESLSEWPNRLRGTPTCRRLAHSGNFAVHSRNEGSRYRAHEIHRVAKSKRARMNAR
jgi:hypothetical protein